MRYESAGPKVCHTISLIMRNKNIIFIIWFRGGDPNSFLYIGPFMK